MEIRITTDLSSEPVSLELIKQYIKFAYDTDTSEVVLIDNLNRAVRSHLERLTGLVFAKKSFEIRFTKEDAHFDSVTQSPGADKYVIPVSPVISITKVTVVDLNDSSTELEKNSDYYVKGKYNRELIYALGNSQELVVECNAGYGEGDTETLPADIQEAIKKQTGRWYWYRDDYVEGKFLPEVHSIISKYGNVL